MMDANGNIVRPTTQTTSTQTTHSVGGVRRCDEQELEEYIEVLRVWAAGEEIEYWNTHSREWEERLFPDSRLDGIGITKYRVKPKPVEVKRWAVILPNGSCFGTYDSKQIAIGIRNLYDNIDWYVVELTGT